ncbi:MAG: hypothetical protein HPY55_08210 [Firmicutes bacterium]|nr:hypothetical protein [Bacillota bacterium]
MGVWKVLKAGLIWALCSMPGACLALGAVALDRYRGGVYPGRFKALTP